MSVIALRTTGKPRSEAVLLPSTIDARKSGNGFRVYASPEDIAADQLNFTIDLIEISGLDGRYSRESLAKAIASQLGWVRTEDNRHAPIVDGRSTVSEGGVPGVDCLEGRESELTEGDCLEDVEGREGPVKRVRRGCRVKR